MTFVDINFDVYSDTPKGRDPDLYSATLRKYHQILWNKPLPNGLRFDLDDNTPRLLHHKSELGEFLLSSDSIGHTYSKVKSMSHIVDQIPSEEINSFFSMFIKGLKILILFVYGAGNLLEIEDNIY